MLREFTDELIQALEDTRVSKFAGAASEAGLPKQIVTTIANDCRWPAGSKRVLQAATPRVACKYLNKSGVSAEWADEVALVTAAGSIVIQGRKLQNKIQELIDTWKAKQAENEKTKTTPPPGPPPGPTPGPRA
jgi:hypothetical protein